MRTHLNARLVAVTGLGLALLAFGSASLSPASSAGAGAPAEPKYIGAAKCKNCHAAAASGDQHGVWKKQKHAQTYALLASPEAKKLAEARGIADPQKSEACLECHVTSAGLPAERLMKGFSVADGVQCESCHGPGETHFKARMLAAAAAGGEEGVGDDAAAPARQEIPAGELAGKATPATCAKCHNERSPTYKPFCFKRRVAEIAHFDPRIERTREELDAMTKCACPEDCDCATKQCHD